MPKKKRKQTAKNIRYLLETHREIVELLDGLSENKSKDDWPMYTKNYSPETLYENMATLGVYIQQLRTDQVLKRKYEERICTLTEELDRVRNYRRRDQEE